MWGSGDVKEIKEGGRKWVKKRNLIDVYFFFQAEDGIRDLVRSRGLG